VLDMLYSTPVFLARRLTTLDVLSGGRLCVGLGLGWSKDEFDAVGVPMAGRGARADEFLAALNELVHEAIEKAISRAKENGRSTLRKQDV
jgi:alkanesulfonate monooxygenase SsuD/methylene tetrahydromethanopterin reductase-like flavin-dependent oxidoreductase (luciferase family)